MSKAQRPQWIELGALLVALTTTACAAFVEVAPVAGYDTIAAEEAAWRQVEPQLAGKSRLWVEQCAGAPLRTETAPGRTVLIYRTQDLQNYCQVSLGMIHGRVSSVSADHLAPEFAFLRDGSNYCGRIFRACVR
jgi:hypothetical protein